MIPQRTDMASPLLLLAASFLAIVFTLASASDPSALQDFCVADFNSSVRVNGLPCLDPKLVNANHFFFSGLHVPSNTANPIGAGSTFAKIPGLNTLGLAFYRADFAPRGVGPPLIHPRASEVFVVLKGTLYVGFVTSNPENRLISKTLQEGDVFVFPRGLLHFVYNVGNGSASALLAFSSQNPGVVFASDIFQTNPPIPTGILAKSLQTDESTIRKLRSKSTI